MAAVTEVRRPAPAPPLAVPPPRRRPAPSLDALFTAVFALFGWVIGIGRLADNSFFWHLRAGQIILNSGFPHRDVFSYTAPGAHWVLQSWLAEVLYAGIDRTVGAFGIRLLVAAVAAAVSVGSFRLALRLSRDRVRAALLTAVVLACLDTLWSERPLVLGILALVVLLWVVEVPDSWVGRRPVVALPVLLWCWANVHGTFALGFANLALHLAGRWLDGHPPWQGRERRLATGGLIGFAVCFLNPYGVGLVTFPVALLSRADVLRHVVEWGSPDFHTARGIFFALWIGVFAVVVARAPGRASRRDLLVTLPFLLLGLWALRNIAVAPLVGLPVAARLLARPRRAEPASRLPLLGWTLAALITLLVAVFTVQAAAAPDFSFAGYPVAAMAAVQRDGLLGRHLLTTDADAGYVILADWPRQRVFMDDRYDMYPRRVIDDYLTVSRAQPGWAGVLARHDVEVIVWRPDDPLVSLVLGTHQWRTVHRDRDRVVLVRDDVPTR